MFSFSIVRDTWTAVGIYLVASSSFIVWLYSGRQDWITPSRSKATWIAVRMLVLVGLYYSLCWLANLGLWVLPVAIAIGLMFTSHFNNPVGGGIVLILVFLQQFVLGFPATGEFILRAPNDEQPNTFEKNANGIVAGEQAVTTSVLRPFGNVMLKEQPYPAYAERGGFIDDCTRVTVMEINERHLVVRATDKDQSA